MTDVPSHPLNDAHSLPATGFGTWPLTGREAERAVADALAVGYRLIDTAVNYGNETEVGRAIAASGVPREEITVTTKVPGRHQGYEQTLASFEESRSRLGLDRLDLYLIHWPLPRIDAFVDTWRAMITLRDDGLVRSLGVSNFTPEHIARLERETGVLPAVNQIELHPFLPQDEARAYHADKGILTESWSPLGKGSTLLKEPALVGLARKHGVTPAQLVLRWHVELGAVPIPKSADAERQRENLDIFGFSLTPEETAALTDRERLRLGGDPDVHEEF
ncbi:aldo/keto reductase [Streptomyces sp. SBT349]|uniref:aldo/keto reductase n=1 Tax=Streptomyces sp. SBT349 TaxID=1580539 RepID=UPI00066E11F9|nr:aldo/keto reductase [Streptomyces sp. SBT349]